MYYQESYLIVILLCNELKNNTQDLLIPSLSKVLYAKIKIKLQFGGQNDFDGIAEKLDQIITAYLEPQNTKKYDMVHSSQN